MSTVTTQTPPAAPPTLSRETVELLCILSVVPPSGCSARELVRSLGLAEAHATLVPTFTEPLVKRGHLSLEGGRVAVTPAGTTWLHDQLKTLGIVTA